MKKKFIWVLLVSGILMSGCGMESRNKAKDLAPPAPSIPPAQIQTESAPAVIVEKPLLPALPDPFDLMVYRVKDIIRIKIKKSVELPDDFKNHLIVIKRHKIGAEDQKTQYTVHVEFPADNHPKAVIERLFDGQTSLHLEYSLTRVNQDDKGNIIAAQSDANTTGSDVMLGKYDPQSGQQLLERILVEQHAYDVKKEEDVWSAAIIDFQRKELRKLRKERRGEKVQIDQEQEQLFASTLYAPEVQTYLRQHELEWLTPQDITYITTYISIDASDQPVEIIGDFEDSE